MTEVMPSSTSVERTPSKRRPVKPSAETQKDKSFSMMEAKPKPRDVLEPTQEDATAAGEAENAVAEIRSKLKGKETILQHPEALGDAQEALREFFDERNTPTEKLLQDTVKKLQTALYEYQARLDRIPTLRNVKSETKDSAKENFIKQREQLKSIFGIIMQANNPAQARKDASAAYSKYGKWRNEQQVSSLQKRLKELNDKSEMLLEKEYALQSEIGHISGKAHLGNSAEEIRSNLKLNLWQRAREYFGSMVGNANVNDLIITLDQVQKERSRIQAQINQTESQINPIKPIVRTQKNIETKSTETESEGFGTEEERRAWEALKAEAISETSEAAPAVKPETPKKVTEPIKAEIEATNDAEELTENDVIALKSAPSFSPHVPLEMDFSDLQKPESPIVERKRTRPIIKDREIMEQQLETISSELGLEKYPLVYQHRGDEAIFKQLMDLAAEDKKHKHYLSDLKNELELLVKSKSELMDEASTDKRSKAALSKYESRIKEISNDLIDRAWAWDETLSERLNEMENELTPEAEMVEEPKRAVPLPPSAEERKKILDTNTAISGMPREKKVKLHFDDALSLDDLNEEAASRSGNVYTPPKRHRPIKNEPSVISSKDTQIVPDIYREARESLKQRIERISAEDKKRIYFSVNEYFRQALERNDAYKRGDEKTGDKIQRQIEKMNVRLREVGAIGHYEDPATTATGKSGIGHMGVIGGSKFTERMNRGALTKNIPSLRRGGVELTRSTRLETKEVQGFEPLTVEWANDVLGKTADNEPVAAKEWERITPLIAEGRLRRKIATAVGKLIKQISTMHDLSRQYYATSDLMGKVRSDSKFNSSPEAAMYIFLKALRPTNKADNQAQEVVDKTLSDIDGMLSAAATSVKPEATAGIETMPVNEAFRHEVLELVPNGKKSPHINQQPNYERVLDAYLEAIKEGKVDLIQAMTEELDELNKEIGIENEDAIKKLMALSEVQETRMAG